VFSYAGVFGKIKGKRIFGVSSLFPAAQEKMYASNTKNTVWRRGAQEEK
jgi:hypothetical protein